MTAGSSSESSRRLADHLAQLDAERFVGRHDVVDAVASLLETGGPARIVFVHGPGGMGKSALLREIGRQMRAAGVSVRTIDGRLLAPTTEALSAAFVGDGSPARVILIDSFEQISALAGVLRDQVLPSLGEDVVVVAAGRRRPAPIWFRDGWEHIVRDIALAPLRDEEADLLLAQYGIDRASALRARAWAKGSPLALHVAAAGPQSTAFNDLAAVVAARLVGDDLNGVDAEVLAVAAIARAVDERLIAAVLPHRAPGDAYRQLRELSVIEPYGTRLALHDLVRAALLDELRSHDRDTYRHLVCRIADHLYDRISVGEFALMDDLTGLIENPLVRAAYSRPRGASYRSGRPEAGDVEAFAALLHATGTEWWAGTERFFQNAPETVTVVRTAEGVLAGYSITTTLATAPWWAHEDAVLGPYFDYAREHLVGEDILVWRDCVDLTHGWGAADTLEVTALLNFPTNMVAEIPGARYFYGAIPVDDEAGFAMRASVGATEVAELRLRDGERDLRAYSIDSGARRQVGNVRDMIYGEQGHTPPTAVVRIVPEGAARSALQAFHDPVVLAEHPLAVGDSVMERAESVRVAVRAAAAAAFGDSTAERSLHALIERAYLDPEGGHRQAMAEHYLARSTYYRRLGEAVDRINTAL